MEQKIYSRAAAKTSLSNFVIDQQNPERSFTRHDLDLLRSEDTWVCCNACNKWRMLPTDISAEIVENLPDEWYCKDNIYDPDRSVCDAEERTGKWMVHFFAHRAREEDGVYSQSQVSLGEKGTTDIIPAFDERHHEYTERDAVLGTLVMRSEEKKTASTSSGKMRWVSKWDFTFNKNEKLEPAQDEETAKSPIKRSPIKKTKKSPINKKSPIFKKSPIKKQRLDLLSQSPTKKSPTSKSPTRRSVTKESPTKECTTKESPTNTMTSPTEQISAESTQVASKQLRTDKKMRRSLRPSVDSSDKSTASPPSDRRLKPRRSTRSSAKSSDKSNGSLKLCDKSPKKKRFKPHKRGSSGKKRKSLEKSATKVEAGSKSPPEKKAKTKAIVDLTFSGSDDD